MKCISMDFSLTDLVDLFAEQSNFMASVPSFEASIGFELCFSYTCLTGLRMISRDSDSSEPLITSGGAKRMMSP